MKYDEQHPDKRMYKRALLLAAVFMLVCLRSWAQQAPWHTEAVPPRSSLPSVSVDLGYPGPYVPWQSVPITLHATASDYPFDGYIGFHFRAKDHRTYDAPVIARAVLKPHESWTFTTYAHLLRGNVGDRMGDQIARALGVEWRDASNGVIAAQAAGIPPWTTWHDPAIPLRVDATASAPARVFGRDAFVAAPQNLSDTARWYAGFLSVVISTENWLDLPLRVREAIFGSGLPVIFHGLPRANQQFAELDRALLPVSFSAQPGAYVIPQPYGDGRQMPVPMSWSAKPFAARVGPGVMPFMVRTAASTWMASEDGLRLPLPFTHREDSVVVKHEFDATEIDESKVPGLAVLIRHFWSALVLFFAAMAGIAGWIMLRRRPRIAAVAFLLLVAAGCLMTRNRIRPASEVRHMQATTMIQPGLVSVARIIASYGTAPIPPAALDSELARTSLTRADEGWGRTEERTSDTPMLMGTFSSSRDWDGIKRWTYRRELATSSPIRIIRASDRTHLDLEYETTFKVRTAYAAWICGDAICHGRTDASGEKGSARIENGKFQWVNPELFYSHGGRRDVLPRVILLGDDDMIDWTGEGPESSGSFAIRGNLRTVDGVPVASFALPVASMRGDEQVSIDITNVWVVQEVSLATSRGSVVLQPAGRTAYTIPNDLLHQLLAEGGVVSVRLKATPPQIPAFFNDIMIEVRENKR